MACRMCTWTCLTKHFRMGLLKADGHVTHIITWTSNAYNHMEKEAKKLWERICCLFFSVHIFTFLRRKETHGEAGLSSPAHIFRAVSIGKLTGKATVGFTTQSGPF